MPGTLSCCITQPTRGSRLDGIIAFTPLFEEVNHALKVSQLLAIQLVLFNSTRISSPAQKNKGLLSRDRYPHLVPSWSSPLVLSSAGTAVACSDRENPWAQTAQARSGSWAMQQGFPHKAQQDVQGGLSTQAHLESLTANLFYQRHPQQLASVKLWRSFGNDKLFLLSLRARSSAYRWLIRGLTCLTYSPFRAGLDHSSQQVTLDCRGKTWARHYNLPFLNAWTTVWASHQKCNGNCDSSFMMTFWDPLEIVRCLSGLQILSSLNDSTEDPEADDVTQSMFTLSQVWGTCGVQCASFI